MSEITSFKLKVGYDKKIVLDEIDIEVKRGEILCLMGPNGSGKSTIIKTIIGHISKLDGAIMIDGIPGERLKPREKALKMSAVLTDRVNPKNMTGYDVVSSGRFPHTGLLGKLDEKDERNIDKAIEIVNGSSLRDKYFTRMSDGEKQRIMIARAIAQESDIMVLDEPTSFLDVRYKIELLSILRVLARDFGKTIVLSLHEIDLIPKIADQVLLIGHDGKHKYGPPEVILSDERIRGAFSINKGSFDSTVGMIELPKMDRDAKVFVAGGGESAISIFRSLNKRGISFNAGIIFENDICVPVAKSLSSRILLTKAFFDIPDILVEKAKKIIDECVLIIDTGTDMSGINAKNLSLIEYGMKKGIRILHIKDKLNFYESEEYHSSLELLNKMEYMA